LHEDTSGKKSKLFKRTSVSSGDEVDDDDEEEGEGEEVKKGMFGKLRRNMKSKSATMMQRLKSGNKSADTSDTQSTNRMKMVIRKLPLVKQVTQTLSRFEEKSARRERASKKHHHHRHHRQKSITDVEPARSSSVSVMGATRAEDVLAAGANGHDEFDSAPT